MRHASSYALLSAIHAFTLAAAGSVPRGVGPEYAAYYVDKTEFSCITNAAIKLSLSQVNDNSCDCPDGSDEPGTAACAYIDPLSPEQPLQGSLSGTTNATNALPGFWCPNAGHVGAYVPFTFVNDGVCDYDLCCDGSEEFAGVGGVKCKNKCAEIGREHRRLEEEKRKNMEKAGKKHKTLVKEAQELRKRSEAKLVTLKDEVKNLEAKRDELQAKLDKTEREERGKVVSGAGNGGKLGVLTGLAKTRVNELRTTLGKVMEERDDLRQQVDELEGILMKFKEEYNPNFNDEGVKAAVKGFEDYAARVESDVKDYLPDREVDQIVLEDSESSGVNWKEFEGAEDGSDTDVLYDFEAYLPPFARSFIRESLTSIRVWLIENGMLADNVKEGSESQLVKAARQALQTAEKDLKDKSKALDKEQADMDTDFGPKDIFRALKGKCTSIEAGEYTYEVCWMDKSWQKSKKGHGGNTSLGSFKRIDHEIADDEERLDGKSLGKGQRMVLRYEDGQSCWNGPKRRVDVWLGCAETEEVWRVSEAEKCVYKMEVGTPAACEIEEAVEEPHGKDEL